MKGFLGAILVAAGAAYFLTAQPSQKPVSPQPSPTPVAQKQAQKAPDPKEAEREAQWRRDVLNIRILKRSLHNPDSFRLEQATRMKDGTVCVTFRATNAFSALVLGQAVIRSDKIVSTGHPDATALWNRYCGGKTGENLNHIRQAI